MRRGDDARPLRQALCGPGTPTMRIIWALGFNEADGRIVEDNDEESDGHDDDNG